MSNQEYIKIEGAYENNLKHISLDIPKKQITIFTGVSGSGKSSLVLDTIAAACRPDRESAGRYRDRPAEARSQRPFYGGDLYGYLFVAPSVVLTGGQTLCRIFGYILL